MFFGVSSVTSVAMWSCLPSQRTEPTQLQHRAGPGRWHAATARRSDIDRREIGEIMGFYREMFPFYYGRLFWVSELL